MSVKYVKASKAGEVIFPYTVLELRKENPNVSFPSVPNEKSLARYGVFPVDVPEPDYNPVSETLVYDNKPKRANGVWTLGYRLTPLAQSEREANKKQFKVGYRELVEGFMDDQAKEAGFRDMATLLSYKGSSYYNDAAVAAFNWREGIWATVEPLIQQANDKGERLDIRAVIATLPTLSV